MKNCDNCLYSDHCNLKCFQKEAWTPKKENVMKPQFTEEEAVILLQEIYETTNDEFTYAIEIMKRHGYIRKSDLEILVEECETMFALANVTVNNTTPEVIELTRKQRDCIRAMKAELNKRRDI